MNNDQLQLMFEQALQSSVGIKIAVSDPSQFKHKFYALRAKLIKESGFEKYKDLKLISSNTEYELWLIKNSILNSSSQEKSSNGDSNDKS